MDDSWRRKRMGDQLADLADRAEVARLLRRFREEEERANRCNLLFSGERLVRGGTK